MKKIAVTDRLSYDKDRKTSLLLFSNFKRVQPFCAGCHTQTSDKYSMGCWCMTPGSAAVCR